MSPCSQEATLAPPCAVKHLSLTTLREKLVKIGAILLGVRYLGWTW